MYLSSPTDNVTWIRHQNPRSLHCARLSSALQTTHSHAIISSNAHPSWLGVHLREKNGMPNIFSKTWGKVWNLTQNPSRNLLQVAFVLKFHEGIASTKCILVDLGTTLFKTKNLRGFLRLWNYWSAIVMLSLIYSWYCERAKIKHSTWT